MMKKKVQAQRKFAQGAFVPPGAERRTDTTPVKDADDKRLAKIFINKVSARNLLDVVSMHNLHHHGKPIVLVERMLGGSVNGADKPKTPEVPAETVQPAFNGLKESKVKGWSAKTHKCRKKVKSTVKNGRDIMQLRSRSSKRKIIKRTNKVCINKRSHPPTREDTPKKKCTRHKSPGFSDDDDMPLNKITHISTNTRTTKVIERDNQLDKITNESVTDDIPVSKLTHYKSNNKLTKQVATDDIPLNKLPSMNKTTAAKELENDNVPLNNLTRHVNKAKSKATKVSEKTDVPLNKLVDVVNKTNKKFTDNEDKDDLPLNQITHMAKINNNATNELEKDDIPVSKLTRTNKSNNKLSDRDKEKGSDSKDNEDKNQFCMVGSAANRSPADAPASTIPAESPALKNETKTISDAAPLKLLDPKDQSTDINSTVSPRPKPVCSESYYGRNRIERWIVDSSATPADGATAPSAPEPHHFKVPQPLTKRTKVKPTEPRPTPEPSSTPDLSQANKKKDQTSCPSEKFYAAKNVQSATKSELDSFCKKCITCRKLSMVVNLKPEKIVIPQEQQLCDVYAFDESELPKEELLGYNPKRIKTKDSRNMYLDLPQNSAHIVKLVEVKMPNQVKPIMRARLVPKTEVSQDETKEKDPVAPKKNSDKASVFAASSNTSKIGSKERDDCSDRKSDKEFDTKPLISYVKAKDSGAPPVGSSNADVKNANTVEAPTFHPSEAEFENPIAYLEKIATQASSFGLCKIVPPPGFKPECHLDESVRFTATNQYPGKMFSRWGPASRELCAIKTHLATQKVLFTRPPLIDSMEVNLPKLYHIVQRMGGLKKVIEKEKWSKVAEELNYQKGNLVEKKLDQVYVKYLLPYDTLSNRERQNVLSKVDREWNKRYKRMLERARRPLHKQRQQLGEAASDSASSEDSSEDDPPPDEADDCVLRGRPMSMLTFEKVAKSVMQMHFPGAPAGGPPREEVEEAYWRLVVSGSDHVCVNTAAVDTGARGLGFTKNKLDPGAKHPWNLKVLSNSAGSVLRSLGAVLSVTVPTLHLGMVFSTSCWHRDPHGLPWLEYHHAGPPKIWYGIPEEQSGSFRGAVEALCPAYCQNKSIWLPSDITMIPPHLLTRRHVALYKLVQWPGEFVVIFPKAYSCSICTGYTISESVYYAPPSWLNTVQCDFQMVRDSFEPTMFSLEQLLMALSSDARVPLSALRVVQTTLEAIVHDELANRRALKERGIPVTELKHPPKKKTASWNVRELDECDICRTTLYLSKVSGLADRRGAHCPQHALPLLRRGSGGGETTLECFYSEDALHAVLAKLRRRLA